MQETLLAYFDGEKHGGLLLVGVGLLGLAAGAVFLQARWGLRSLGVTLAVFALLELALGIGLYLRTGPQVRGLLAGLGADAPRVVSEEGARMAKVQRNFVAVEYVEVALIVIAAVTALAAKSRPGLAGVALGVLIHAAFLLAFDLVAERRGAVYLRAIEAQAAGQGLTAT